MGAVRNRRCANSSRAMYSRLRCSRRPSPVHSRETPEHPIARFQQEIATHPERAEIKLDLALAYRARVWPTRRRRNSIRYPRTLRRRESETLRHQLEFTRQLKGAPDEPTLRSRLAANEADYEARDCSACVYSARATPLRAWTNSSPSCVPSATGTTPGQEPPHRRVQHHRRRRLARKRIDARWRRCCSDIAPPAARTSSPFRCEVRRVWRAQSVVFRADGVTLSALDRRLLTAFPPWRRCATMAP